MGVDEMKRGWRFAIRLVPLLLLLTILATGCGQENLSTLQPKGDAADSQYSLIKLSIGIMLFVVSVVVIIFVYVLIRFRAKPGDNSIPKQVEGSAKLEFIWTAIPIILLIILAIPTVKNVFFLAQDVGEPKIKVTAHQFWWEFEYTKYGLVTSSDLVIPVGEKVPIEVASADVIHSFWVPGLGGKIDTNPTGQNGENKNITWLHAEEPGVYKGKCAEFCGPSHTFMDFKVIALPQDEYEQWVAKMKQPAPQPVTPLAQEGEQLFAQNCIACHAIDAEQKGPFPNLAYYGERQTVAGLFDFNKERLAEWIKDPQGMKPGNQMIINPLTDQEVDALVEYLSSLKFAE